MIQILLFHFFWTYCSNSSFNIGVKIPVLPNQDLAAQILNFPVCLLKLPDNLLSTDEIPFKQQPFGLQTNPSKIKHIVFAPIAVVIGRE